MRELGDLSLINLLNLNPHRPYPDPMHDTKYCYGWLHSAATNIKMSFLMLIYFQYLTKEVFCLPIKFKKLLDKGKPLYVNFYENRPEVGFTI